ncbi:hypothetical protein FBU30_005904 [Linnemannia zychae]|nr:hypothetical protein FBU30_005904 [Linnemannia zychae]
MIIRILENLLEPWFYMCVSLLHIPITVKSLVVARDYRTLFSPSLFREALFGELWATAGPQLKARNEEQVTALLEGRIKGGRILDKSAHPPIHGIVLEVGAGSGMWADVLARLCNKTNAAEGLHNRKNTRNGVTKIYGIEPSPTMAKALQKRVEEVGLQDIYEVVPVGIECVSGPSAWNGRIEPESVDCIVSIMCMCSIPEPEKNIKLLYSLLKPGGYWFVCEHVKNTKGNLLLRLYQRFCNIGWPTLMGSCSLCRETEKTLNAVGVWQDIDLAQPAGSIGCEVIPQLIGILKK